MANLEWEEELGEYSLEDILAEVRQEEELPPLEEEEEDVVVKVMDTDLFDKIKEENSNPKTIKRQAKQKKGFSTFDIFKKKKEVPKREKPKGNVPHTVLADRAPKRKENREKLSQTIDLNDLFESGDEYDEAQAKKHENYEAPADYVRHNALSVRTRAIFVILNFLLCIPAIFISFGENMGLTVPELVSWSKNPQTHLIVVGVMEILAIVLNAKIFFKGIRGIFTASANMFSVMVFSAVAVLAHGVSIFITGDTSVMPYCGISVVMLFFCGLGNYFRESGRLRACRAASVSKIPMGIFISERDGEINLIKQEAKETEPFTKYVCMADGAERFWTYFAPIVIVGSIIFATISSVGAGEHDRFLWALSAITTVASPFFMMLCYGLPFSKLTKKLSVMGAALGGWYAAFSMSGRRNLIMRDSDLFPKGTVTSHGLKVFNDFPLEKIVSYATSMLYTAKSGLYPLFAEILKSRYGKRERVNQLMHHESGGMQGEINGDSVVLGKESFILRMGIKLIERSGAKNTMYLAINGKVAAAFNLRYRLSEDVKDGLDACLAGRVNPVLASVDCNLTPVMIESEMGYTSGTIEYPNIEERLDLSRDEVNPEYDPVAFVTRAGLSPFAAAVNSARRLRKVTIRNTILSAICAVVGMLFMAYITFVGAKDAGTPYNAFLYMSIWTFCMYLLSSRCNIN